jgi:hypothetical protein
LNFITKKEGGILFVLLLSDQINIEYSPNYYGYYTGKCFKKDECVYPATDRRVEERTKKYTSKVRAESAGIKLLDKCTYVLSYKVEEI